MSRLKRLYRHDLFGICAGLVFFLPALVTDRLGFSVLCTVLYVLALLGAGHKVFISAVRGILRRDLFDEKLLMSVASVGAMIIGEMAEGVAVMLFFLVGEFFEHKAIRRSRASIKALMDIRPDTARVLVDGVEHIEDAEDVEVGSTVVIRAGERVPMDCTVISGVAELDTSMLTGESVPRPVEVGDLLESGTVVMGGVLVAQTVCDLDSSAASRIIELVEEASERKSREESFITSFSRVYTPIVTSLALLMAFVPPIFSLLSLRESVYRALSFLVVSCPCALVISVPMAFFGGIGGAASRGILFKGGNTFRAAARAKRVVFDKTGTLTDGSFSISCVLPAEGVGEEELLSLAASCESKSNHPIARAISGAVGSYPDAEDVAEITGEGVVGRVAGADVAVGSLKLMSRYGACVTVSEEGAVHVAKDGKYIGSVVLSDKPRYMAREALMRLRRLGVKRTYVLSGDRESAVKRLSSSLGIDSAYSELLPAEKYAMLEKIISEEQGSVIYVGDGINDSPSLARADLGIAMGGCGSDSAIEAADAVIMSDDLLRIPEAILIARKTLRIAKENIIFALGVKLAVLVLASLSLAGMWLAVFADVGVAVLAILNSMRTLSFGRRIKD